VNRTLAEVGLEYRGTVAVKHFLWVLLGDVGPDRIREKVARPLRGLRVAPFYGCHILRPASMYGVGASDGISSLERLCELVGAEPVPHEGATGCCGFHVVVAEEKIALRMSGRHLAGARAGGAHCLVTPCPLCHTVLDAYQPDVEREVGTAFGLPILHVSQLVGLAAGLAPEALGLSRHVVDAGSIIKMVPSRSS
jgi:succinate dehydrogenase / fumarate reductase cytochrome b subunit